MGSEISRPAYSLAEAADVAAAANLIASEARAAGCTVVRPFNGARLEGRPTWTAAHSVMWWHVDMEYARDAAHDAERDALRARAEAAEQRAEALAAELAQARAEGEAAGAARERAAVVAYLREPAWATDVAGGIERGEHVGAAGTAP